MNNPFDHINIDPRLKKTLPYLLSAILLVVVLGGAYLAADNGGSSAASSQTNNNLFNNPTSTFYITLELILKVVFVFGLMYLFFALLRLWQRKQPGQAQNRLRIVESVRPSPRQTFYLLRVGSQEFLVGATDQSMNLISEIDLESLPDPELEHESTTPPEMLSSFNALLQQTLKPSLNIFRSTPSEETVSGNQQQVVK